MGGIKLKIFVLTLAGLWLAGCASVNDGASARVGSQSTELNISAGVMQLVTASEKDQPVVIEEDSRVICRQYRPTGSHRLIKFCQTVEEYLENKDKSKNFLRAFGTDSRR